MEPELEKVANKVKLCYYLKTFGKCETWRCRKRHLLSKELEAPADQSYSGLIKFKIVNIIDVNVYCVNILKHEDLNGEIIQNLHDVSVIEDNLTKAISKEQYYADNVEIGDWFAFGDTADDASIIYRRCEVTKIIDTEKITSKARIVKIILVDSGLERKVNVCQLFLLPSEFRNIPAQGKCF